MFFAEDSPAKTSLRQVKDQELLESVQSYGRNMRDSLARCNLDLSLPKTHLCFALGDLELSSKTWPRWGIMLDGELSELGTSVRPIREIGCGSWPTPDANMGKRGTQPNWTRLRKSGHTAQYPINQAIRDSLTPSGSTTPPKVQLNPAWLEWLMGWPIGWTDLQPLVTDKFQDVQPWHSTFSQKD